MSKYTVYIYGTVSAAIEVEAEDIDDAMDEALAKAPQTSLAGADFDGVGEWEVSSVESDGETVFEEPA